MDKELQTALLTLHPAFVRYLESLRDKKHSLGGQNFNNTNAVFVSIGKNLVVDEILDAIERAKNPKQKQLDPTGLDVIMYPTKAK